MVVVQTDKWLLDCYDDPIRLCEKLEVYFGGISAFEIYDYLTMHGMYRPLKRGIGNIKKLRNNNVWEVVQDGIERLQKKWDGPDIPVFIFPSDSTNRELIRNFNGKSGLAYKDKLLLFLSPNNVKKEIEALLTHEYNHVCRLNQYEKDVNEYVLLDTIILEGLAEQAVDEQIGTDYLASWTTFYTNKQLKDMWQDLIFPNRHVPKEFPEHDELLYGISPYPKMAGYSTGYYLIKQYVKRYPFSCKDLLSVPSEQIIKGMK
ncbi:DUF2268 domain-containing protein [Oceanobacillus saliphilus]|uniref:DUF2268 domain-containing protein n=1 Tax=Oceanobacillus saliphilus TaxID=2925834 RepID=UPI00201DDC6C|nr:DUF2268 domain-containing protein [Oceanobacillus saliphilus]